MYYPNYETFQKLAREGNLVPVYREILADTETPVSAFMKLRDRPYAFLLESVEGGEKWGRYTFLGYDPQTIFRFQGSDVLIQKNGTTYRHRHQGNPLEILRKTLQTFKPVPVAGVPRFYGGAVGFLGYDMVRYFERLPAAAEDTLQIDDAAFILTDSFIVFDNVRHTIKAVACAFIGEGNLKETYDACTGKIEEMLARAIRNGRRRADVHNYVLLPPPAAA